MKEIVNPYNPDEPISEPSLLFGRREAMDWIEHQIQSAAQVLILSGQPYVGKTSFIHQVGALQSLNTYNAIISLDTALITKSSTDQQNFPKRRARNQNSTITVEALIEYIVTELVPQLATQDLISTHRPTTPIELSPSGLRELFVDISTDLHKPYVLYFDDLHHLLDEDISLMATFLSLFIPILDECPRLHLVFTVDENRRPELRHPLLDSASTFNLSNLSADASIDMITLPVRNILRFDYGVTRRIAEINSNHPYYLTLFCHTLVNRQGYDGWVNQRALDATLAELLASPIESFNYIWDNAHWGERAVLAGMAAMQGKHGPVTQQEVIRFLQKQDSNTTPEVVIDALERLAARGVLVPMGAISYKFYVELLRFWLREHTELTEILKDVDWSRLASVLQKVPKSNLTTPPPAVAPRRQARFRAMLWSSLLIVLFLCAAIPSLLLASRFFDIPLPFLTPQQIDENGVAEEPVIVTFQDANTEVVENNTPTPDAPLPTATPTPALVVARSLPSIAYMARDVDQAWRIYVMNADGSEAQALSTEGVDDTTPIWSPDGQKIALVSRRDGNREIYVMDVTTKEAVNVTRHPADDWTPAWSPDGAKLAFSSIRDGGWEIYVMDTTCLATPETCRDSLVQITADNNGNISPVWSPDGTRFVFNSKATGNWDIFTMAIDGSDIRQVTVALENDLAPVWSPDATQIAFESNREGNVEIYVIDSNGVGPAQNISNISFADDHGPTWSPDGQSIIFYSNREGNWDIFSVAITGQTVTNLTQTAGRDEQTPAWRP